MRVYCKKHVTRIPFGKYRDYCITVSCPYWTFFNPRRKGVTINKANIRGLQPKCESITTVVNERG